MISYATLRAGIIFLARGQEQRRNYRQYQKRAAQRLHSFLDLRRIRWLPGSVPCDQPAEALDDSAVKELRDCIANKAGGHQGGSESGIEKGGNIAGPGVAIAD